MTLPAGYFWDSEIQLGAETTQLTLLTWPNYLVQESDLPDPELSFEIPIQELRRRLPVWGIRRQSDRRLVASASGVLIPVDLSGDSLPDRGWRFAMDAFARKETPTALCLLAANVDPEFRSQGFARHLLDRGKDVTTQSGLRTMIGPVRPVSKSRFPDLSMAEYLSKKNERGEIYDPWLRLHVDCGARVLNICHESVLIRATLPKWREWTGLELSKQGEESLVGGLAPLKVDLAQNLGVYQEPNVWVRYDL